MSNRRLKSNKGKIYSTPISQTFCTMQAKPNMQISISENLGLELIDETHSASIFEMVDQNRTHLREWLGFVDHMKTLDFAENFVQRTMERNSAGLEYAFVIVNQNEVIGRIGVYKIDNQNKIGEIGYWMVEKAQGKGIVTEACKALIAFCFIELALHRIEIKCATENHKSNAIAENLKFSKEGVIRQGELLHDKFVDLNLYALLKID